MFSDLVIVALYHYLITIVVQNVPHAHVREASVMLMNIVHAHVRETCSYSKSMSVFEKHVRVRAASAALWFVQLSRLKRVV